MPFAGTLDTASLLEGEGAPVMDSFDAEPWSTPGTQILQAMFEIDESAMTSLLPPALHPTIPPTATLITARYPESPAGPFSLAQVRIGCRAAALPRGFVLRAYCDSPAAIDALRRNWGYPCLPGEVKLSRYHDRVVTTVSADGLDVLRYALIDPEPVSGADIQYTANLHLARAPGWEAGVLVQVDPEYIFHKAERGRASLEAFAPEAWRAQGLRLAHPIVASFTTCDTGFPHIRFVADPALPAVAGTKKVG